MFSTWEDWDKKRNNESIKEYILMVIVTAVIIMGMILLFSGNSEGAEGSTMPLNGSERASEDSKVGEGKGYCQDPDKLSPKLREAYFELKELEKEIEGMTVSIRCWNK